MLGVLQKQAGLASLALSHRLSDLTTDALAPLLRPAASVTTMDRVGRWVNTPNLPL